VELPRKPVQLVHLPLYGQLKGHVSFSELRLFNECQWKWLLLKVFGTEIEDRSYQMDFGKAVHSGMEVLYGPGGTAELATQRAFDIYDEALKSLDLSHPSDRTEAHRIRECIPGFYRDCLLCEDLQGITTLKSELQLMEPIERADGLSIKFKGFIDIVFIKKLKVKTVIYVADFKTCQWGWPAKKLQDIEVLAQLLLYKHFFCKMMGADPRNVSLAFILLKKKPKDGDLTVSVEKIGAGPKATRQALDYLQRTITGMHSYSYEKNFSSCVRSWIDKDTKEERIVSCPFMGTEMCPGSAEESTGK
jgi:hypothetical protein